MWLLLLYVVAMAGAVWLLEGTATVGRLLLTLAFLCCLAILHWPGGTDQPIRADRWSTAELVVTVTIVLFLTYACYALLRALLRAHAVKSDTILQAINMYIVIGLVWSLVYAILERALPGAFHFARATAAESGDIPRLPTLATFTYYSFITQATQGYGDIVPAHPLARSLVVLHTIMGQLYVAILMAYLLGLYVARGNRQSPD
jgi:hypothetical protein